ncbi:HAD hydrolase-like protein [bacterium]|nr:HAD hydrolase-like protein [bacterium]
MNLDISKIKRIYFDFDGTLVNSNPFKETAISQSVLKINGSNARSKAAISYFAENHGIARTVKLLHFFEGTTVDKILIDYNKKCQDFFTTCLVDALIKRAILHLHNHGIKLFVLSGGNSNEINSCLAYNDMDSFFDDILDEKLSKTDHLLSQSVDGSDLVIGDSIYDYNCAKATKALFASILLDDSNILHKLSRTTVEYASIKFMNPLQFLSFVSISI